MQTGEHVGEHGLVEQARIEPENYMIMIMIMMVIVIVASRIRKPAVLGLQRAQDV